MRILVSSSPWPLAWSIPDVVAKLLDAGAELVFAGVEGKDPVPEESRGHAGITTIQLPVPRYDARINETRLLRSLGDLTRFYAPEFTDAHWSRRRTARRILHFAGYPHEDALATTLSGLEIPADVQARVHAAVTAIERRVPASPALVKAVRDLHVDAVLLVSRCSFGGAERDLLKVAAELELHSVMLVWSWDNLSSKAALQEHPDHLLVWNELQVDEAQRLHDFPRERVHALGAPSFDPFFAALENIERPRREHKTIVYLGSSSNISTHEPDIFAAWLQSVREAKDPIVRNARIVVRPYPTGRAWKRWRPDSVDSHVVVDRGRKWERGGLAATLSGADAVAALNTSGELEAAIAGLPVVTFRAGPDAPGQEGSIHFEYLLEDNGGFVVDSRDLNEHVANLGRMLRGGHEAERQRRFIERFVRPLGLDRSVSPIVTAKILELIR
jgi:hypothetical protein